jgi:hypothetical protein
MSKKSKQQPQQTQPLKRTYLVQRLLKPLPKTDSTSLLKLLDFGAFGVGLTNGGFSKQAMQALNTICRFDYMGASEFEWGAVPNAFKTMLQDSEKNPIVCRELQINPQDVRIKHSHDNGTPERATPQTLWVFCLASQVDLVLERVKALTEIEDEFMLCERTGLGRIIKYNINEPVVGWIELDNGFVITLDAAMRDAFAALFSQGTH